MTATQTAPQAVSDEAEVDYLTLQGQLRKLDHRLATAETGVHQAWASSNEAHTGLSNRTIGLIKALGQLSWARVNVRKAGPELFEVRIRQRRAAITWKRALAKGNQEAISAAIARMSGLRGQDGQILVAMTPADRGNFLGLWDTFVETGRKVHQAETAVGQAWTQVVEEQHRLAAAQAVHSRISAEHDLLHSGSCN